MITIVLSYYENGLMLERHLEEWAGYAPEVKAELRAVVVDDGSPRDPAVAHLRNVGFPVDVYRIRQNLIWNVAGARNLGMTQAPDGWCRRGQVYRPMCPRAYPAQTAARPNTSWPTALNAAAPI